MSLVHLCAQPTFKLDSIHQYSWDEDFSDWKHNTRDLYKYDNGGIKETNLLRLVLNGDVWENFYQFNKLYDGNNNLTESILQNWGDNMWNNGSRDSYTYDASNNTKTFSYAIYSGGDWMVFNENIYEYNLRNDIVEDHSTKLDFTTLMMVNDQRLNYFYDADNLLEFEILEEWRDVITEWENEERKKYTYNIDEQIILIEIYGWSVSSMEWGTPYRQTIIDYNDSNLPTVVTEQTIASGSWVNTAKVENTYDGNNNLVEILGQEWNSSTQEWENSYRQLKGFDANNNEIELIFESWNASNEMWEGFLRLVKFWSEEGALNVEDSSLQAENIMVYPNPVIDDVTIKVNSLLKSSVNVVLFDVYGNKVNQESIKTGATELKMSLQNLSSGIYFLRLNDQKVYKMVKQ